VKFPPKAALPKLVNSLKGVSSRRMRQEFADLRRHHWKATGCSPVRTSPGRSGSPISALRHYIEQQNRPG
jgi:putative transposase